MEHETSFCAPCGTHKPTVAFSATELKKRGNLRKCLTCEARARINAKSNVKRPQGKSGRSATKILQRGEVDRYLSHVLYREQHDRM